MRKIKIWIRARFCDWPYWRVTYNNGERTYRLHYREAKGLRDVFGGKLWIDYSIEYPQ
jgi:hypothetical protein